ncbi:uridine diphosphate-N-acetylglucosamine-binding protein YvcK [Thalassotalea litorea]|uniref:Putative gluconeogenesis factor n=1 Tax=Thalassotalea litorea TaxID=2020715 RepID=A0A5R9IPK0_9GAMM|nr:uridine diphosphate-N-acetylglucosamine-binding protein YvcK [Thalassotalea litorea]TLU67465.1 uridine diphosphate-N-acetylglucosamine-binding protein YvcK [Thalassotalea litorea]
MRLQKLNVVAIGGGHGLGRVLSTLSFLGDQLTGIVATTDNGGSTGKLRKRTSSIAWGDLRNCLTQLVEPESVGNQLFNFRFDGNDELGGHNLGNLILFGLNEIQSRPLDSINLISRLLRVKTKVYPMSETPTDLLAFYEHGRCKVGEISVDDMPSMPNKLMLAPLVKSIPECLIAIENADLIILGPGSFLTSVVPPLLVNDLRNAIERRTGQCVFIDNINQEDSPAGKLLLDDKLNWLESNLGCLPIDTVITPDSEATSSKVNVVCRALNDAEQGDYHDKKLLLAALEDCAGKLSFASSDVVNG